MDALTFLRGKILDINCSRVEKLKDVHDGIIVHRYSVFFQCIHSKVHSCTFSTREVRKTYLFHFSPAKTERVVQIAKYSSSPSAWTVVDDIPSQNELRTSLLPFLFDEEDAELASQSWDLSSSSMFTFFQRHWKRCLSVATRFDATCIRRCKLLVDGTDTHGYMCDECCTVPEVEQDVLALVKRQTHGYLFQTADAAIKHFELHHANSQRIIPRLCNKRSMEDTGWGRDDESEAAYVGSITEPYHNSAEVAVQPDSASGAHTRKFRKRYRSAGVWEGVVRIFLYNPDDSRPISSGSSVMEYCEVIPSRCPSASEDGQSCAVHPNGWSACFPHFSLSAVHQAKWRRFVCDVHNTDFCLSSSRFDGLSIAQLNNPSVVLSSDAVRTRQVSLDTSVLKIIELSLMDCKSLNGAMEHIHGVFRVLYANNRQDVARLISFVSRKLLRTVFVRLTGILGSLLDDVVTKNCQLPQAAIALDHTFKVVANVGRTSVDGRWIKSYHQLLTVMDSDGNVVGLKVTNDMSHREARSLVQAVLEIKRSAGVSVKAICTDDVNKDTKYLREMFGIVYGNENVEISQDWFHVLHQRIAFHSKQVRINGSRHPDLKNFVREHREWWDMMAAGKFASWEVARDAVNDIWKKHEMPLYGSDAVRSLMQRFVAVSNNVLSALSSSTPSQLSSHSAEASGTTTAVGSDDGSQRQNVGISPCPLSTQLGNGTSRKRTIKPMLRT